MKKIESCRGKSGFINLNKLENYKEKGDIVEGSNAKAWFNVDGVRFLFKEYNSLLPAYGEVLYSKVAKLCEVNCASYDFAIYNGKVGTISYDFLKENTAYYNFLELTTQFGDTKFTLDEIKNNRDLLILYNNRYNNLLSIKELLKNIFNINDKDCELVELELIKMFCLDALFWHEDRRLWNYGVVVDENSDSMCLAPCHDNSHVLRLEKGEEYIESVIFELIGGNSLENIVGEYDFGSEENDSIAQLLSFYEGCNEKAREEIEKIISNVDIEKEVENLNLMCKIGDITRLWVKAVLNYRQSSILNGIESVKMIKEDKPKKPNVAFSKRK